MKFFPVSILPEDQTSPMAACPRCGLRLCVIPTGDTMPGFDLRVGLALEHLRDAADAIQAATGMLEHLGEGMP